MRALLIFLAVAVTAPLRAQNVGSCNFKESCPYRCCRGVEGDPRCYCSLCCMTQRSDFDPDDRAQKAVDGPRTAAVYRHRVEFFQGADPKPRAVRSFEEGIYPIDVRAGADGLILICTSSEWGVRKSTGAERGFCGGLRMDGRESFRFAGAEEPGLAREPVGLSERGKEALIALTKARKGGEREIVGYRLWIKGRLPELLPPDGTRVRKLLEKYEGPLVMPDSRKGD